MTEPKRINLKKKILKHGMQMIFIKRYRELYLKSIHEEQILQQTRLDTFDAIIIKGNVRHLRPTLFDLACSSGLGYFESDESRYSKTGLCI